MGIHKNDATAAVLCSKDPNCVYLGNVIGNLLVGVPADYFYLGDYKAGGPSSAEEDRTDHESTEELSEQR